MTQQYSQTGAAKLWTASQGVGIPILLCNGGPGCCDYMTDVAAMIDDIAFVIRWEQRGCGRSAHANTYTLEQTLSDIEAVREHFGFDEWLVAGHSWGADLALTYALEYPDKILGAVCISGGRMNNDREWSEAYRKGRDERGELQPEYAYPHNQQVNSNLNTERKLYIQQPDLFKRLSQLPIPVSFIYGSEDIRPSWAVEQIAHLLPNGEYHEIQGAEHVIWLTHAERLKAQLRLFIRQISASL